MPAVPEVETLSTCLALIEIVDWIHEEPRIDYCLVNTNGVRSAKEDRFLEELGKRARRGNFQLYLQFRVHRLRQRAGIPA